MIIGQYLMVKLDLTANSKHQVLYWDNTVVMMKDPSIFIVQSNSSKRKMREVFMQAE